MQPVPAAPRPPLPLASLVLTCGLGVGGVCFAREWAKAISVAAQPFVLELCVG